MAFDLTAAAYDILSDPDARLAKEGAFLKTLAGKGCRVLDVACATGVHAEYLARWGAEVTACDLSEAMIEVARPRRPHPRLRYAVRDMREPPEGPFDLVLCLGNALNMLPARDDVRAALDGFRRVLAPTGRLLLQCIQPDCPAHREPKLSVKHGTLQGRAVHVVKSMLPVETGRVVTVTHCLGPDAEGETPPPRAEASRLLDLDRTALADRLLEAGFASTTWHGDMTPSPFVPGGSPDMIVVAGCTGQH